MAILSGQWNKLQWQGEESLYFLIQLDMFYKFQPERQYRHYRTISQLFQSFASKAFWTSSLTAVQLSAWMQSTNLIFLLVLYGKITTTKTIKYNFWRIKTFTAFQLKNSLLIKKEKCSKHFSARNFKMLAYSKRFRECWRRACSYNWINKFFFLW